MTQLVRRIASKNDVPAEFARKMKAIASDMDGTFFASNLTILPATLRAYERAMAMGISVIPATGRSKCGVSRILTRNNATIVLEPGCYLNGQSIVLPPDTPESLAAELVPTLPLDLSLCRTIIDLVARINAENVGVPQWQELPGVKDAVWEHGVPVLHPDESLPTPFVSACCYVLNEAGLFSGDVPNRLVKGVELFEEGDVHCLPGGWDQLLSDRVVLKFCIAFHSAECSNKYRSIFERLGGVGYPLQITAAVPRLMEVSRGGVTKASTLAKLGKLMGFELSEIAAIGDGDNDIEMLQESGLGIAMGNASRCAVDAADCVTEHGDKEGWAIAINALLDAKLQHMAQPQQ